MQFDRIFWRAFWIEVAWLTAFLMIFAAFRAFVVKVPIHPNVFLAWPFVAGIFGLDKGLRAHRPDLPRLIFFLLIPWVIGYFLSPVLGLILSSMSIGFWGIWVLVKLLKPLPVVSTDHTSKSE